MKKSIVINIWDKFWDRTYIWKEENRYNNKKYILCKCKCWKQERVYSYDLMHWKNNRCKSCRTIKLKTIHWLTNTRFYRIWRNILSRCNNNKVKCYYNYWWRWIKCLRNSFNEFKEDMYEWYIEHVKLYWEKDTTIDRINVNDNYYKDNCKRSTLKEQANNKRKNIK